ncbi:CGNR zinc finger domain-containing protein [Longispora albida]|uniref:CGNR zinc finger domain-containing protein n=1 Tax=Longispora albida TaxID=203523 RepID=UPI00036A8C96|nr:ABATE domain-containing protein [Longispora albida]
MRQTDYSRLAWLGGPLALDLANTLPLARPDTPLDLISTEEQLSAWLHRQAYRLPVPPPGLARFHGFRRLRDALFRAFAAVTSGEQLPREIVGALNSVSNRTPAQPRLLVLPDGLQVEYRGANPVDIALALVAASGVRLLGSGLNDLRRCPAPGCGLFFLGTPRRRWCSDACGARARSARHYARVAGGGPEH